MFGSRYLDKCTLNNLLKVLRFLPTILKEVQSEKHYREASEWLVTVLRLRWQCGLLLTKMNLDAL